MKQTMQELTAENQSLKEKLTAMNKEWDDRDQKWRAEYTLREAAEATINSMHKAALDGMKVGQERLDKINHLEQDIKEMSSTITIMKDALADNRKERAALLEAISEVVFEESDTHKELLKMILTGGRK